MIPRIWIATILCALGGPLLRANEPLPFEKLIKLEGKEFVSAAEESYGDKQIYTVDELIAVAEKLAAGIKPLGARSEDHSWNSFSSYFGEACKNPNDQQLDKLIELYRRLDPNTFEKSYCLPTLASRVLARQVAALPAQHLQLPEVDESSMPSELESAPEELQNSWRSLQRGKVAFEKAFQKTTEQIAASENMKSFYNLIGEALKGATGLEDDVRRFARTGANCLDMSDIEDARDIAMLLMLLREGRMNEAIGAALKVAGADGSESKPEAFAKTVIDLFERCGLDWEQIFAGGQVEREIRGWGDEDPAPYLAALAKYGSTRAAPLVHQLAYFAKPKGRGRYVATFNAWIETTSPKANCGNTEVRLELGTSASGDRKVNSMPPSAQSTALRATEDFATAEASEDLALNAINIFRRTQLPSSIPALKALTHHSSRHVVEDAALVLCAMGEQIRIPAIGGPVRFQILTNGKPLPRDMEISWRVFSENGSFNSEVTVQPEGVIEISRAHFTTPDRPATKVELKMFGVGEGAVIFDTEFSPPWSFDEITKVDLRTASLEIVLGNREGLNAPPPDEAFVGVKRVSDEKESSAEGELKSKFFSHSQTGSSLFREGNKISVNRSIRLPAIADGKYEVWIGVRGAEVWHQAVTVGPKDTKVDATLHAGSDLRFEVLLPDGRRTAWGRLLKDGAEFEAYFDSRTYSYHALPCGKYVLRIPGSDPAGEVRDDKKIKRGPDEIPYQGRDISFTVEKGSPALIDLGEIHLEKAPAEANAD